jgi:hypothetical protein
MFAKHFSIVSLLKQTHTRHDKHKHNLKSIETKYCNMHVSEICFNSLFYVMLMYA